MRWFLNMWSAPYTVNELIPHEDPRGVLIELLRFTDQRIPSGGQVYVFTINPGYRRGDHYHEYKREWFTCVHGQATVLLTSPDGKSSTHNLSQKNPSVMYVAPGTVHALRNESEEVAVIISYGCPEHNPDSPDTYAKQAFPEEEGKHVL